MKRKKSSLKTFLAGRHGRNVDFIIDGAVSLTDAVEDKVEVTDETDHWIHGELWSVDVLEDGTAITYKNS